MHKQTLSTFKVWNQKKNTNIFLFLCLFLLLWSHLALSDPDPQLLSAPHFKKRQPRRWSLCRACMHTYGLCTCMHWSSVYRFLTYTHSRVWPVKSRKPGSLSRLEPGKGRGCGWTQEQGSAGAKWVSQWARKDCGAKLLYGFRDEQNRRKWNRDLRCLLGFLNKHEKR